MGSENVAGGRAGDGEITARRSDTRRMRGIFSLRGHARPSFYAAFLRSFDFSTLPGGHASSVFTDFHAATQSNPGNFGVFPMSRVPFRKEGKWRSELLE